MAKSTKTSPSRLTRSQDDKVIAGVCAGLAEFFNIDVSLVRLIFVLITVFGGSGVLLYIILWLVIPTKAHEGEITKESLKASADEMKQKAESFAESAKDFSKKQDSKKVFGIIVIVLGIMFLLNNFEVFHFFNFARFWPLILIIVGVLILTRHNE